MSSTSNSNAIKTAMAQLHAAIAALDAALGTPSAPAAAPAAKKKVAKPTGTEDDEVPAPVAAEPKVRKPTAWNAYVVENGGVKAASALKKADPAAYEAWAAEWKEKNPDPAAVPIKAEAAAEPKARKPRSDKGKPRAKKPVADESAAEDE